MPSGWYILAAALCIVGTAYLLTGERDSERAAAPDTVAHAIEAHLVEDVSPDEPPSVLTGIQSDKESAAQPVALAEPAAVAGGPAAQDDVPASASALSATAEMQPSKPDSDGLQAPPAPIFLPPLPLLASADSTLSVPRSETARRATRSLPGRIDLKFSVQSGEDGFVIGQSIYSGWIRDGRYSLTSVAEATGVTGVFVTSKIVQRSEGRITAKGLQPELFSGEKGKRIQKPVRFDWSRQRLALPGGEVVLPAHTQDLLSFSFHLALVAEAEDFDLILPVTNGKKLRDYRFRFIGREKLNSGASRIDTVHLRGSREGDGSLDVWLAPDLHWLPVRIRTLDDKGKTIVLSLKNVLGP